jgi:hypothetical protein
MVGVHCVLGRRLGRYRALVLPTCHPGMHMCACVCGDYSLSSPEPPHTRGESEALLETLMCVKDVHGEGASTPPPPPQGSERTWGHPGLQLPSSPFWWLPSATTVPSLASALSHQSPLSQELPLGTYDVCDPTAILARQ